MRKEIERKEIEELVEKIEEVTVKSSALTVLSALSVSFVGAVRTLLHTLPEKKEVIRDFALDLVYQAVRGITKEKE